MKSPSLFLLLAAALLLGPIASHARKAPRRILVYTRNYTPDGKGYVHDNIATSVEAIKKLGAENKIKVDASDDPSVFTDANLKHYGALVFSSSNNEAFASDAQRDAFKRYLARGGGLVGIHSATGSERQWPWFWQVMGGKFLRHPRMQTFTVRVADPKHPIVRGIPATFEWTDECYYHDHLSPNLHPLLVTDPAKLDDPKKAEYPGGRFGDAMPLAWWQTVEGGRECYLALGHKKEHYSDPTMLRLILNSIEWALSSSKSK
jgi:uncharacterized protein